MLRVIGLLYISQAAQALIDNLLEIRLPYINHGDDLFSMTKPFGVTLYTCWHIILWRTHRPQQAPIMLASPQNELELNSHIISKAKLPELVRYILGRIGRSAITSHENLVAGVVAFLSLCVSITKGQYPTARHLTSFWLFKKPPLAEHLKSAAQQPCMQYSRIPC